MISSRTEKSQPRGGATALFDTLFPTLSVRFNRVFLPIRLEASKSLMLVNNHATLGTDKQWRMLPSQRPYR